MSLTLEHVSFAYENGPVILKDTSFTFEKGVYHLVRGPSGSGKSTLLRLLCLLEEIDRGVIRYKDCDIHDMAPPSLRRCVAYVQQMPSLLPGTVRDNLLLPFSFQANKHLTPPNDVELTGYMAGFLLDGVTLDSTGKKLSVGQAQRICLIRSLLLSPDVILLDEPTASLDAASAKVVLERANLLRDQGVTVIMISHSENTPDGVDRVVSIKDKRLVDA